METNKIYEGKCLDVIRTFPDKSIDCVITSPPYWQLRDYGWDGQWGNEPTFQMYLENLWSLMDEIYRVLKDTGTCWINLGDTYGTKSGNFTGGNTSENKISYTGAMGDTYTKDAAYHKCLLLIPHRFAIGCIDRGWIMRNDIVWAKRNGMPESVTDRFSKKHEYFFFMAKSEKYYFDLDGIRQKSPPLNRWGGNKLIAKGVSLWDEGTGQESYRNRDMQPNNAMKNPGSVSDFWDKKLSFEEYMNLCQEYYYSEDDYFDIPTQPSKDAHYASYNTKLIDKPIVSGCPQYVCNKCGKPREKIIENIPMVIKRSSRREDMGQPNGIAASGTMVSPASNKVIGLTDCGCNEGFSGGIILDPFCGTATTGCRSIDLNRKFIGIEGKPEYVKIANDKFIPLTQMNKLF